MRMVIEASFPTVLESQPSSPTGASSMDSQPLSIGDSFKESQPPSTDMNGKKRKAPTPPPAEKGVIQFH